MEGRQPRKREREHLDWGAPLLALRRIRRNPIYGAPVYRCLVLSRDWQWLSGLFIDHRTSQLCCIAVYSWRLFSRAVATEAVQGQTPLLGRIVFSPPVTPSLHVYTPASTALSLRTTHAVYHSLTNHHQSPPRDGVAMQVLARNNTAPVPIYSGLTSTMSHNPRSSQLSGSTAVSSSASSTTLTPSLSQAPATPVNGGPVIATNNIINQKADASRSLYQICVNLRQRLSQVPGFSVHLTNSDEQDAGEEDMDPVSSLWRCLRKGIPLVTLYNTLQPAEPLIPPAESVAEPKKSKMAAFKFVEACMKDLGLPPGECFAIGDLFGDDTTGFVKVRQAKAVRAGR